MKKVISLIIAIFLLITLFGCSEKAADNSNSSTNLSEVKTTEDFDFTFTENDISTNISNSEIIELSDDIINITSSGAFKVTGMHSLITVKAPDTAKVQLILEDVEITSQKGPAIYIDSADKVFITVNSSAVINDSAVYDSKYENVDGAIFSRADLTINGGGKLTVCGNYKCGVVSKDDLVISGVTMNVTSVGASIEGKDCVKINNASIIAESGTDGIKSTNSEDLDRGFIYIKDGSYKINAQNDAIQAENTLLIDGGNFNIKTGGGSQNSSTENKEWGGWKPERNGFYSQKNATDTESAKGIKAAKLIQINGGELNIDSSDDAVHSNTDVLINGGNLVISSGDDGIHADSSLVINSGDISVMKSYEGLEATAITIADGDINITASDDGLNAAGGNDSSAMGGRPGQNSFMSNTNGRITVDGGYLIVDASGDGIDSNGSITINGGTLLVNGPENSGNGAFDYDSTAQINGGTAILVGSSGMAQGFSQSSEQISFTYGLYENYGADDKIALSHNGEQILEFEPTKTYNHIVISSPTLSTGEEYTLKIGNEEFKITLSSVTTAFGNAHNSMGGGMPQRPFK